MYPLPLSSNTSETGPSWSTVLYGSNKSGSSILSWRRPRCALRFMYRSTSFFDMTGSVAVSFTHSSYPPVIFSSPVAFLMASFSLLVRSTQFLPASIWSAFLTDLLLRPPPRTTIPSNARSNKPSTSVRDLTPLFSRRSATLINVGIAVASAAVADVAPAAAIRGFILDPSISSAEPLPALSRIARSCAVVSAALTAFGFPRLSCGRGSGLSYAFLISAVIRRTSSGISVFLAITSLPSIS